MLVINCFCNCNTFTIYLLLGEFGAVFEGIFSQEGENVRVAVKTMRGKNRCWELNGKDELTYQIQSLWGGIWVQFIEAYIKHTNSMSNYCIYYD